MKTSDKVLYKVEVKLTSTTTERTSNGFSISKLRGTETIYVSLDSDFEINSATMGKFIELVREQLPLQILFFDVFGDRCKMWIEFYSPCP